MSPHGCLRNRGDNACKVFNRLSGTRERSVKGSCCAVFLVAVIMPTRTWQSFLSSSAFVLVHFATCLDEAHSTSGLNCRRRLPAGLPTWSPVLLLRCARWRLAGTPLMDTLAVRTLEGSPLPSSSLRSKSLTLHHDLSPDIFIAHENTLKAVKYQMKVSAVLTTPTGCRRLFMCVAHCHSSASRGRACDLL